MKESGFVALESYDDIPENRGHRKDENKKYLEIITSWYLHLDPPYEHRWYNSFDEFMNDMFSDYQHVDWIRFSPGAMYIARQENILYYSRNFWNKLMGTVGYAQYTMEAHLLERAMYYIFTNTYKERL